MSVIVIVLLSLFVACGQSDDSSDTSQTALLSADSILDNQIYQGALYAKDGSKCADISDAGTAEECKNVIESLILMDEASLTLDKSLCNKIKLKRYEEECEKTVKSALDRKEDEEKMYKLSQEASDKNDANICDGIKDEGVKYSCRYNVLANKAIAENDPAYCDEIGDETSTRECKNILVNLGM